ncbi:FG-GAP repeat protein [Sorangium sp. So ce590]|uniref:FG-GAP repeat protein n=1 Tax=Sorangium sp. So ce590 TaxID=3133317 RepID=UPI003F626CC4
MSEQQNVSELGASADFHGDGLSDIAVGAPGSASMSTSPRPARSTPCLTACVC